MPTALRYLKVRLACAAFSFVVPLCCLPAAPCGAALSQPKPNSAPASLGTIAGRVTFTDGTPAAGFKVGALPVGVYDSYYGNPDRSTTPNVAVTDSNGRYIINVVPWSPIILSDQIDIGKDYDGYQVWVSSADKRYFEPSVPNIDIDKLPNHSATGINFVLKPTPRVFVRACDAVSGAPDADIPVRYSDKNGFYSDAGRTGADGTLGFNVPLTQFRLNIGSGSGTVIGMMPAPGCSFTREIADETPENPNIVWDIKTVDLRFGANPQANTVFHGIVLDADGAPVAGAAVHIALEYPRRAPLTTDASGAYSITLPDMGWGIVTAEHDGYSAQSEASSGKNPAAVELRLGLERLGAITGVAVDPRGRPLASLPVACEATPHYFSYECYTGRDGRFTFRGLSPDARYQLKLGGNPLESDRIAYGTTLLPDQPDYWVKNKYTNDLLNLDPSEIRDMGQVIVYPRNRQLGAQLIDEKGKPYTKAVAITLIGEHTSEPGYVDDSGRMNSVAVVNEPLTLAVYDMSKGEATLDPDGPDFLAQTTIVPGEQFVQIVIPNKQSAK